MLSVLLSLVPALASLPVITSDIIHLLPFLPKTKPLYALDFIFQLRNVLLKAVLSATDLCMIIVVVKVGFLLFLLI